MFSGEIFSEIEFPSNYSISDLKLLDLFDNNNIKVKLLAVGINIFPEENESKLWAKLEFYNIQNSQLVKVLQKDNITGVINLIQNVENNIIVSEGPKLVCYVFKPFENELVKVSSSLDNKNLPVCSRIRSKLILIGDINKSLSLILFEKDNQIRNENLVLCGSDTNTYYCSACDFYLDSHSLNEDCKSKEGFILSDYENNFHIFMHDSSKNSLYIFSETSDIHLGKRITDLAYIKFKNDYYFYSSDDGSIGMFKSIDKENFLKLKQIENVISKVLPWRGGCNPTGFFQVIHENKKNFGNILDYEYLTFFLNLSISCQQYISQKFLDCNREIIMQNILDAIKL